ncbi:MAG: phosphocholine cytidylyltransferase family protein [Prevotellaceae bacterium]|nr:phosphocholine cytidylyltransferase family protein [Prevotellaceae bacterium]
MQAVILAAGTASRLRPLTDNCPKCLLSVKGKTLLERTVEAITSAGISEITVVTGYKADMIEDFLCKTISTLNPDLADVTFHFIHNDVYATTNNIYSLWLARPQVDGKDFLLMDSDIYCDPLLVKAIATQTVSALAVNRHELGEEEMKVVVDADYRITEISKTCNPASALGESVGVERINADYSTALYKELEQMCEHEGLENKFYELAFERLIPQGHTYKVIDTTDFFSMELDTVEDFDEACKL